MTPDLPDTLSLREKPPMRQRLLIVAAVLAVTFTIGRVLFLLFAGRQVGGTDIGYAIAVPLVLLFIFFRMKLGKRAAVAIELDPHQFVLREGDFTQSWRWTDLSVFRGGGAHVYFIEKYDAQQTARFLPTTFGQSARELADTLNAFRERALARETS